ncbi:hypothetical protein ACIOHE_26540 [Streptomyces sp. NPDC087851]|uniref:hypothetical protein n=1 Tax=Streptomyces sp. NPDC087851 TaxID=3365810 RepID=UPI00382BE744
MQDRAEGGEDAAEWLREHFKNDPAPEIKITWTVAEPNPVAFRRIQEILFAPRAGDKAA